MASSTRDTLAAIVQSLDLLRDIENEMPTTIGENMLDCLKRIAADRRALIRLLHELEVKPDKLWAGYYEDTNFAGWANKPIEALRKHLGLADDPGDLYHHKSWSQEQARLQREKHAASSENAIRMAEAWMAEAERRKAAGL